MYTNNITATCQAGIIITDLGLTMCPNDAYNELLNLYLDAFNESFPIVEISSKIKQQNMNHGTHLVLDCFRKKKAELLLNNYQYLLNIAYKNIKHLIYCIQNFNVD